MQHPRSQALIAAASVAALAIVAAVGMADRPAAAQSGWQPGPPMRTARASFPLVALPSGDLLAAGGVAVGSILGTTAAEVFDVNVASPAWRPVAAMSTGHRYRHHGLSLGTGEALVVGEEFDLNATPLAERFTESTGAWAATHTGPAIVRFAAHLTLLADGRALYSGGYGGGAQSDTYASAELYDPASGTWVATGDMASPRFGHGAVRLQHGPNAGRVLIAGGSIRSLDNALATCELYDPATGTWQTATRMGVARLLFTMTPLPDGRVLAVGGLGDVSRAQDDTHAEAELYDPATGRWSPAAAMATGRARHTATLLPDGRVLVAGGSRKNAGEATASVAIYDPATDVWTPAPDLHTARQDHAAVLLPGGAVMVIGGLGPDGVPLASTEILTPTNASAPTTTAVPPTTNVPSTPAATNVPAPSATPFPTPFPEPMSVEVCPQIKGRVPAAAIAAAMGAPETIRGYGQLLDPSKPKSPANPVRRWLSLTTLGRPYSPLANGLVYKVGCP